MLDILVRTNAPGSYQKSIDLSDLPGGIYTLQLRAGSQFLVKKILKVQDLAVFFVILSFLFLIWGQKISFILKTFCHAWSYQEKLDVTDRCGFLFFM